MSERTSERARSCYRQRRWIMNGSALRCQAHSIASELLSFCSQRLSFPRGRSEHVTQHNERQATESAAPMYLPVSAWGWIVRSRLGIPAYRTRNIQVTPRPSRVGSSTTACEYWVHFEAKMDDGGRCMLYAGLDGLMMEYCVRYLLGFEAHPPGPGSN